MLLIDCLNELEDPRDCNTPHELTDLLFVALAAMLCGATHCTEIAMFGQDRLELLRQFVPLKNGVPSHDTFSRVFRALDPAAFNRVFRRFMVAFGEQARIDTRGHLAVDGKSLRGAYDKGKAHMPPLVATVFACETFMSVSQVVAKAGGEAAATIAALELLSLKGCTVTADALHCHRRMTQAIRDRGGDYVLAIKGNQSKLAKEAAAALDLVADKPETVILKTEDHANGRHEVRQIFVTRFTQTPGRNALVGLRAVARLETWRTAGGETTHRVRHFALSRLWPPEQVLNLVRGHWGVENDLHWQLDVLMREDEARTRRDNGPENLALLRRLALNMLRAEPTNLPLKRKYLKARWKEGELLRLMTHMQ